MPLPYGGKVRQVMVDIESSQLEAKSLSPLDVVNAVNAQNVILPSGTAKIGATEYNVGLNGTPSSVQELNDLPITVYTRSGYLSKHSSIRNRKSDEK